MKTDKVISIIMTWATRLREHNKGLAAQIRRSSSIEETLMTEAFMYLRRDLRENDIFFSDLQSLAVAATIAIRLEPVSVSETLGKQLKGNSDQAVFSKLRFQKLLASEDYEDLLRNMKNAVDILNKKVNTFKVIKTILEWESYTTKLKLAEDYYL